MFSVEESQVSSVSPAVKCVAFHRKNIEIHPFEEHGDSSGETLNTSQVFSVSANGSAADSMTTSSAVE